MPEVSVFQTSLNSGELDPQLAAREDIKFYFSGLETLRNFIPLPTGGAKRRPGLKYIDTLPANTDFYDSEGQQYFQVMEFRFSDQEEYTVVMLHNGTTAKMRFYLDDSQVDTVDLPYTASEIQEIKWAQSLDTMILCHEDYEPRRILRSGGNFSVGGLTLENIPQFDFDDGDSPEGSDEEQRLDFDSMAGDDAYDLTLEGEQTQELQWSSTSSQNAERMESALNRLSVGSGEGISVEHDANDQYVVSFTGPDGERDWELINVLILTGGGTVNTSVNSVFTSQTAMTTARRRACSAKVDGKFYVIGGQDGSGELATVEEYDPSTDSWTSKTDMPTARRGAMAAAHDGLIYVMGGWDGNDHTDIIERYDPSDDSWDGSSNFNNMPTSRFQGGAVELDGIIYVVGGGLGAGIQLQENEAYDPEADSWETSAMFDLNQHPYRIRNFGMTVLDGKIYTVGGFGDNLIDGGDDIRFRETFVYDPIDDSWEEKAFLPNRGGTGTEEGTACTLDGKIYYIGGANGLEDPTSEVFGYSLRDDNWSPAGDLSTARKDLVCENDGDEIYAIGGYDGTNPVDNNESFVPNKGASGAENVWSSDRGWPRTVTFYQGRMFFGGSKSRPQTIWGSRIGDFFNFGEGENEADAAINVTADTDSVSSIRHINPGRNLQIFTSSGEFFIPEEPITPTNISIVRGTENGVRNNTPVVNTDGAAIYIQDGGKALQEFLFQDVEGSYVSNNISLLSSHLLQRPVDMALRPSSETDESDLAFIVNNNGTMAVLSTLRNQDITAFSDIQSKGEIRATGVKGFEPYFVVERTIEDNEPASGQPVYHLEKYVDDHLMDASYRNEYPSNPRGFGNFDSIDGSIYGGDTGAFSITTSTVLEGDKSLEGTSGGIISDTGSLTYFQGMEISCLVQPKGTGNVGFLYGTDSESGSSGVSGYEVVLNTDDDDIELHRIDSGAVTLLHTESSSESLTNGTTYVLKVRWKTDDTHLISIEKTDGTVLASTDTVGAPSDSTYTSGGHGFRSPGNGGYFDRLQIEAQKVFKNNLDHLSGETVQVYGDGQNQEEKDIDTNGDVTIEEWVSEVVEFGYDFEPKPKIKTMPLSVEFEGGPMAHLKKRVVRVMLRVFETKGLTVEGEIVSFSDVNDTLRDTDIDVFTGDKEIQGILGYSRRAQIEITQPDPQPATVLGILNEVAV